MGLRRPQDCAVRRTVLSAGIEGLSLDDRMQQGLNTLRTAWRCWLLACCVLLGMARAQAQEQPPESAFQSLDQQVQALKGEVLDLNLELFVLEEELLFP